MRLLVDSASLWYRAFYGLPESTSKINGMPNNAIKGFFDGLSRIVTKYRPDEIGICLDDNWRPSWRVELFPGYKLHRMEDFDQGIEQGGEVEPDLLTPQIGPIIELCTLLGLEPLSVEDQEADDVIATLAGTSKDRAVRIMTGDRDLFQLISNEIDVQVIYLAKGISQHELVDGRYISEKYSIPSDRYLLFAAIRGDASDGLPGIRGIGDKGAAKVASCFSSMDEVIAAAERSDPRLTPLHTKRILESIDYARIAERLVSCRTDLSIDDTRLGYWRDRSNLIEFRNRAKDFDLGTTIERVTAALDL
ncbi:MAG: 5'-3' exonuclease [Candidatus Nanopelagicaceae bacterium]|jgi:5'-3' exonuclease